MRDLSTLERIFWRPSLQDYHKAGREVLAWTRPSGSDPRKETVRAVSKRLGLGTRILWDVRRFARSFDDDMVRRAEAMGASWTDIRQFMNTMGKAAAREKGNLAGLEAIVADRRRKIGK